jgi:hypothetical protein
LALTPTKPNDDKRAGSDEAFLREVEDAVRSSDLQNFWRRYGRWLLGLLVIGLASFGGWIFYQNQQRQAAEVVSEEFVKAMDDFKAGNDKAALAKLALIAKSDQPGYRAMSQIMQANIAAKQAEQKPSETGRAVAAFAKVAQDSSLPKPFRDLALLRQTMLEFDTLEPQKTIDRLKPLAVAGNPWFGTAGEMTAISYRKLGKDNLAGPIFAQIAKQEDLPASLRSRAAQMAGALGIDAVQLDDKKKTASGEEDASAKGESK